MEQPTLQGHYAGSVSRLAAYLIDATLLTSISALAAAAGVVLLRALGIDISACPDLDSRFLVRAWICHGILVGAPMLGVAFPVIYGLFFWTATGQTPGKAIMGLRIVRLDGRPMTLGNSIRRVIGYGLSHLALGLGFLVMLVDDRRQGWHDKLAGTCVLYSWKARENTRLVRNLRRLIGLRS